MAHALLESIYRAQGSRLAAVERAEERMRQGAREAVAATVEAGARCYDRARMIPHLIRMTADDWALPEPALTNRIICRLDRAIEAQRALAIGEHWAADPNRLIALKQALAGEFAGLEKREIA